MLLDVTKFFHEKSTSISALRQKTYTCSDTGLETVRCKLVLTVPENIDINEFIEDTDAFLTSLSLEATITDTHQTNWSE